MRAILSKCSFAVCVLTVDAATSDGQGRADQDVVHQAGIFHGKYGFGRVAMLVEDGCEIFSNAAGLVRLPFSRGQVDATFLEIERMLGREGLIEENDAR
jgi:predicted nucleotide-binding protein